MRTTVNIDDQLLERAKERARQQGSTLGELVEQSIQALLSSPAPGPAPALPTFPGGRFRPGIDPTSNASMLEAVEGDPDALRGRLGLDR